MSINNVEELRIFVHKVLPLVYDDSLSYYEVLCKCVAKLNEVVHNENEQNEEIERIDGVVTTLGQRYTEVLQYIDSEITRVTTQPNAFGENPAEGKFLGVDSDGHFAWMNGGEPDVYLKNVTVVGNTLTFTKKDDTVVNYQPSIHDVPSGGTTGQVLTKKTGTSYDTEWASLPEQHDVPVGGTTNQVLAKASNSNYDLKWAENAGIPAGGTTAQVLAKVNDSDYNVTWVNATETPIPVERLMPAGGTDGQVLAKNSGDNYDATWVDPVEMPEEFLVTAGVNGNMLTLENNLGDSLEYEPTFDIPTEYVKDVTGNGNALTFTMADGSEVDYEPTIPTVPTDYVKDVGSTGNVLTFTMADGSEVEYEPTFNVDTTVQQGSTNAVSGGAVYNELQNIPTEYVKSASVEGNTLTLVDESGVETTYTPAGSGGMSPNGYLWKKLFGEFRETLITDTSKEVDIKSIASTTSAWGYRNIEIVNHKIALLNRGNYGTLYDCPVGSYVEYNNNIYKITRRSANFPSYAYGNLVYIETTYPSLVAYVYTESETPPVEEGYTFELIGIVGDVINSPYELLWENPDSAMGATSIELSKGIDKFKFVAVTFCERTDATEKINKTVMFPSVTSGFLLDSCTDEGTDNAISAKISRRYISITDSTHLSVEVGKSYASYNSATSEDSTSRLVPLAIYGVR